MAIVAGSGFHVEHHVCDQGDTLELTIGGRGGLELLIPDSAVERLHRQLGQAMTDMAATRATADAEQGTTDRSPRGARRAVPR